MNYFSIAHQRRNEITCQIYNLTKGLVATGPFQGMYIDKSAQWGDGDIGSKLLGCYESELHPYIEKMISSQPDCLVNVGCGEGFYGVGIGRRSPLTKITMIDVQQRMIDTSKYNASRNNVVSDFSLESIPYKLEELLHPYKNPALVMDCEGFEMDLIRPDLVPALKKTMMIIELHDFMRPNITSILKERCGKTHTIIDVPQGAKNPYLPIVSHLSDWDKMLICVEGRPCTMHWFIMTPI